MTAKSVYIVTTYDSWHPHVRRPVAAYEVRKDAEECVLRLYEGWNAAGFESEEAFISGPIPLTLERTASDCHEHPFSVVCGGSDG